MKTVTIKDSYSVGKRAFHGYLVHYCQIDNAIAVRNWNVLKLEWAAHNGLYALGLWRSHTRSVDFEHPQKWWVSVIWCILGSLMYPFIR